MDSFRLSRFFILGGLIILSGCGPAAVVKFAKSVTAPRLKGSGIVVTETREVELFHAIELDGSVRAIVTIGDAQPIELSGEDNILPELTTEVQNGVLAIKISYDGGVQTTEPIVATIVVPSMNRIELDGACSAEVVGVESEQFGIELDGASQLKISCHCTNVLAKVNGASKLEIAGSCKQFEADVDGAGRLNALEFLTENVNIKANGAARAVVYASGELNADSDGAASVKYAGTPVEVRSTKGGASSIKPLE